MSNGKGALLASPQGELLSELRGGSPAEPDAVPPVRAAKRRASSGPVAHSTGREDIEAAVAASGLKLGDRASMTGTITYLSADSKGDVWMQVRLDDGRGLVDCWAGPHKRPAGGTNE